jgi:RimJ/RimL family protein N-acetyltransferase
MSFTLVEVELADFAWFAEDGPGRNGLRLPPGGVDAREVLAIVRGLVERLHAAGSRGAWMMVDDDEVVGLCSYTGVPNAGRVSIGYGVSASRRGRGYASAAVAELLAFAARDASVEIVVAETAHANRASQIVLERNAFERVGTRADANDGELVMWERALHRSKARG